MEAEIARVLVTGVHEHEHLLAAELRQKFIEDYKDTVFRGDLYPEPLVRGPHGYGRIDLKPGARPICAHKYRMTGERGERAERLSWEYLRLKLCEWAKPSVWIWDSARGSFPNLRQRSLHLVLGFFL